jgi:hypothetical protein
MSRTALKFRDLSLFRAILPCGRVFPLETATGGCEPHSSPSVSPSDRSKFEALK